jgi:hypothetical protein
MVRRDDPPLMGVRAQFSYSPPPPKCGLHHPCDRDCVACRARKRWTMHTRRLACEAGVWEGRVDATAAAAHLRKLAAMMGSVRAAAAACGVSPTAARNVVGGAPRVLADIRNRILAVPVPTRPLPRRGWVWSHGTIRRVQAAALDGWSARELSVRCGLPGQTLPDLMGHRNIRFVVSEAVAAKVRATVDMLDGLPGTSTQARRHARRCGWLPLEAWADVDDPDCQPWAGRDTGFDEVLIEQLLSATTRPDAPPCWHGHRQFPHLPPARQCPDCRWWVRHRVEAVRRASQPPYGSDGQGLSADDLARRIGVNEREVQRIRTQLCVGDPADRIPPAAALAAVAAAWRLVAEAWANPNPDDEGSGCAQPRLDQHRAA